MLMEILRSVGLFICTLIAFMANGSWRFLICSPVLLVFLGLCYLLISMNESPRYMMSMNNTAGVTMYLNAMAKANCKDITVKYLYPDHENDHKHHTVSRRMWKKLFGWKMFRTTFSLIIIWAAQSFGGGVFTWLPAMMFA